MGWGGREGGQGRIGEGRIGEGRGGWDGNRVDRVD